MPTTWVRRRGPEAALGLLAAAVFLGFLGSVELWGKREQRASAEAIDTVDRRHWLVAEIQGRPRLEKPPLPRWTVAALVMLTGRRGEAVVRLPGALAAVATVGLVYGLGRRLGGRSVGLASGLALTSMGFFVSELRQAGNDGLLAFFTTLALYAAWRRLHGDDAFPAERPGPRRWNLLAYAAVGLGFLTKGPVILPLVALTVVPYLACARRLRAGLATLADGRGLALFLLLALGWPVAVLLAEPGAANVWLLEMGQKAGLSGVAHGRWRLIAADWPLMTAPWLVVATTALALPFRRGGHAAVGRPGVWFPWWWAAGNLAMFCSWSVAKPNYFLPCLPGVAILCGAEWVRLTRAARDPSAGAAGREARGLLQAHWVVLFTAAVVAPVVTYRHAPDLFPWAAALGLAVAAAVLASAWLWRNGADAAALAPLVAAVAVLVLTAYGRFGPAENALRGHRALAAAVDRILPADARTVMFFRDMDEGLWFYFRGRDLVAVPGSQPRYNDALLFAEEVRGGRFRYDPVARLDAQRAVFLDWARRPDRGSPFVLMRAEKYDQFAPALDGLAEPLYRETGTKRNAIVLLRLSDRGAVAAGTAGPTRR